MVNQKCLLITGERVQPFYKILKEKTSTVEEIPSFAFVLSNNLILNSINKMHSLKRNSTIS